MMSRLHVGPAMTMSHFLGGLIQNCLVGREECDAVTKFLHGQI
jgi:hypothetical protein